MSRRTRLKFHRPKQVFSLAHHSDYASTTTYFPKAYSLLGNDIKFPKVVLPFYLNNKIHFVGKIQNFFVEIQQKDIDMSQLKLASLSFQGQKYQQTSWKMNLAVYSTSLMCFCFNNILDTSFYRDRYFPKYKLDDYDTFVKIIEYFNEIQTLIINFQDNDINPQKMKKLDQVISKSKIKTIILRNLCYFISTDGIEHYFEQSRKNTNMNFKFIWEKFNLVSLPATFRNQQEEQKLINMSDQIQS